MAKPQLLFTSSDPFGNPVSLDEITFRDHIVSRHPEMHDALGLIEATVRDPYRIRRSTVLPEIAAAFERNFGSRWYRVIVEYSGGNYARGTSAGRVTTSYRVDAIIKAQVGGLIYEKHG